MAGLQHLPPLVLSILHLFALMLHPLSKLLQFRTREVIPPSDPPNETPPESTITLPDATSLSALDISNLYSLSNASPTGSLHLYIQLHLEQRFNTLLARWFSRPLTFREALQITQSAISGSAVVSYAIPSPSWESTDLDIYTPAGQAFSEMLEHFTYSCSRMASSRNCARSAQPRNCASTARTKTTPKVLFIPSTFHQPDRHTSKSRQKHFRIGSPPSTCGPHMLRTVGSTPTDHRLSQYMRCQLHHFSRGNHRISEAHLRTRERKALSG